MNNTDAAAVFDSLDRELWIITAGFEGKQGGLIATMVQSASIVPDMPRVVIGLGKRHFTRELVERSGGFALHLLSERHLDWVWRFGMESGRTTDKLAGLGWTPGQHGSPLLTDALAWLDCAVEATLDTGDRSVYLGEVKSARRLGDDRPLTMKRMLQLAPPERKRTMKEQYGIQDAALDAVTIGQWRLARADR